LPEALNPFDGVIVSEPAVPEMKLATTFFGPFMMTEAGLVDPERSPDQNEKL
jgi:hypothetical protein